MKKLTNLILAISGSKKCWLMHDDVIIKSGITAASTPVHHDRPYFIFKGDLNLSLWIAITEIPRSSSLVCYKRSHLSKKLFLPKMFITGENARGYMA